MLMASWRQDFVRTLYGPLDALPRGQVEAVFAELAEAGRDHLARDGIDGGIAEPIIVVPTEAALVERDRAGEEHRELPTDHRGRVTLGRSIARQRDAVTVQPDLDALDLIRHQVVLPAHRDQRVERGVGVAAARIRLHADLHRLIDLAEIGNGLVGMRVVAIAGE